MNRKIVEKNRRLINKLPKLPKTVSEGLIVLGTVGLLTGCGSGMKTKEPATADSSKQGYTEIKRTTKAKMAPATSTLGVSASVLTTGRRGDAVLKKLNEMASGLKGTAAVFVIPLAGGTGKQPQIDYERTMVDGMRLIKATANVSGENKIFYWMHYQKIGVDKNLLLNPRYTETSQPRYIGAVMRNITLTDGTNGDFVVRVYGNRTGPLEVSEFSPIVEKDGRVRPENVLHQLETGGLNPQLTGPFVENLSESVRQRASPVDRVIEYGATTSVVVVSQQ
ncbi:hypothetical protein KKE92_01785 [Candidatus Micrarchaeota archaeon]|nr:hypothetical protein [Candidatus Micrarchaeota archaeon]MBU1682144.1 hypothetical protein [Candidatus Micrarchaeota archaeon]